MKTGGKRRRPNISFPLGASVAQTQTVASDAPSSPSANVFVGQTILSAWRTASREKAVQFLLCPVFESGKAQ